MKNKMTREEKVNNAFTLLNKKMKSTAPHHCVATHVLHRLDARSLFTADFFKTEDSVQMRLGGSTYEEKRDKLGRDRSQIHPMDLVLTKQTAEELICLLEAYLKMQGDK